ncbi:MAG: methyltransferase [Ancalomicrobiaceae bacterium]|nr:methyltransferase [Ancalomicrobiaceae bacterium]
MSLETAARDEASPGNGQAPETTVDRLLGGRIEIEQPKKGWHRAGLDALFLAANVPDHARGLVVDLGAGVGTAGMAAAARAPGIEVMLVERDSVALDLARANLARPANAAFSSRCRVVAADISQPMTSREAAGLSREIAAHVLINPPFWPPRSVRRSPAETRAVAHVLAAGGLEEWARVAVSLLEPRGRLTIIYKGDGLAELLPVMADRVGEISIFPLFPRAGVAAHRLIVSGVKGSRAAPRLLPGMVLHPGGTGRYLPEADAILRGERGLTA